MPDNPPDVGDFNGDGRLELVVSGLTGFYFLPGNGDGTFGAPTLLVTDSNAISARVVAGDFNRDGILDLAVDNFALMGSPVSIYLGEGDGTFPLSAHSPLTFFPAQIH